MALTTEQKAAVKRILGQYHQDINGVIASHRAKIVKAIEDSDKRKIDSLEQRLKA